MKNLLLCASVASLLFVGCDNMTKKDMPPATPPSKDAPVSPDRNGNGVDRSAAVDRSAGVNRATNADRSASGDYATPLDQSESAADRTITQNIRQRLVKNEKLSTAAKNVKIISQDGNVILNGEVANEDERMWIDRVAKSTSGVKKVENNLMLKR